MMTDLDNELIMGLYQELLRDVRQTIASHGNVKELSTKFIRKIQDALKEDKEGN